MKKLPIYIIVSFLLLVNTLTSCSDESSKFEGTWRNKNNTNELITIVKSGKNLIIETQNVGNSNNFINKLPASYDKENDKLIINRDGFNTEGIIDIRTQNLIIGSNEYIKL